MKKSPAKPTARLIPKAKHNKDIVNLAKAPKNERGRVEYSMDVFILKPLDMARGNQTIFYDVVNRGNQGLRVNYGAERSNDPTTLAHAGDGFMMGHGYSLVWSGWQGDMLPSAGRLTANFPVAKNPDGSPIKRWISTEFVFQKTTYSVPLSYDRGSVDIKAYPAVEESMAKARLTRRAGPHAPREAIANDQWSFARCPDGKETKPSLADVCYAAGFSPDFIYELAYEARDPMVMGLGLAATRDLISFLRHDISENNPLFNAADNKSPRWAIGFGSSQSGRFLKDMLYQGFNQDESGKIVLMVSSPISRLRGEPSRILNLPCPGVFQRRWKATTRPATSFPLPTKL